MPNRTHNYAIVGDLVRGMGTLALEGIGFSSADRGAGYRGGSPRERMLDKPADAGELAATNRRGQPLAKATRRIRHGAAPGFCYSGLTPSNLRE